MVRQPIAAIIRIMLFKFALMFSLQNNLQRHLRGLTLFIEHDHRECGLCVHAMLHRLANIALDHFKEP